MGLHENEGSPRIETLRFKERLNNEIDIIQCARKNIFFFDNFRCPGQRSIDTHTLTNPKETCNTLLTHVPR